MSLTNLVKKLRVFRKRLPKAPQADWQSCARLVLQKEFGAEPTPDEVAELIAATKRAIRASKSDREFFDRLENGEDEGPTRQTRGGRRIVHKSEPMAG